MKLLRVPALLLFLRCLPAQDLSLDLVAAARSGDLSQVKALLDKGADVNARGRYGQTALLFASNRGHLEVVKLLLAAGADVDAGHTFYGATALTWAATKGYVDIVRLLIGKTEGGPAKVLPVAVLRGNAALVKLAIENGAAKADLWSALVAAERAKKAEIVELLKSSGAQPPPPATFQIDSSSLASYAGRYRGRAGAGFDFIFSVKDGKLLG
ncbi:MAG: ankyrin repeat domain-containing protein, partial [Bryobacteraceae bacterium]